MIKSKKLMIGVTLGLVLLIIAGWSDQNIRSQQEAKYSELEEKIQRLEDIEQIEQLKARYFRYVDEKKWTDLAGLFTADARIVADGQEYPGGGEAFAKMIGDLVAMDTCQKSRSLVRIKRKAFGLWRIC